MAVSSEEGKATNEEGKATSASASDIYDRQIRLWGIEAQNKMATTKVLYVNITGVSSEILKNLVLAGIRAEIYDNRAYPDAVLETPSFLLSFPLCSKDENSSNKRIKTSNSACSSDGATTTVNKATVARAVKPIVEELNFLLGPCKIIDETKYPNILECEKAFFEPYSIIVASNVGIEVATHISKFCNGAKLFLVDCFGMDGACVIDFGNPEYKYLPEIKGPSGQHLKAISAYVPIQTIFDVPFHQATNRFHKKAPPTTWMKYRSILQYHKETKGTWPSSDNEDDFVKIITNWIAQQEGDALSNKDKDKSFASLQGNEILKPESLKQLALVATSEIAPICSVLGGIVGNEIIKAISGKGEPANNTILFDGDTGKAFTFLIQPK